MPIESGPTGERKVRSLLLFLMVFAFGLWFAYDGWRGYPKQNYNEHIEQLPPDERSTAKDLVLYDQVIEARLADAQELIKLSRRNPQAIRDGLAALFGGPPSFESKDTLYYFGPTYRVTVTLDVHRPINNKALGRATDKTATDILFQKGLAIGLLIFSAYLLYHLAQVHSTKLVLDESGLRYRRTGSITWDAMRTLDISNFSRKGFVDLEYDEQGKSRRLRLDEYHLEKFDDVIDEICARKGFENPLPVQENPAPQA